MEPFTLSEATAVAQEADAAGWYVKEITSLPGGTCIIKLSRAFGHRREAADDATSEYSTGVLRVTLYGRAAWDVLAWKEWD